MKSIITFFIVSIFFISCNNENEKPSIEVMKECLINELGSSVKIIGYEHQDGVVKIIDGVKLYDAFFNAEVKFLSNVGDFHVGDEYKLVKVSVQLMKTENGWNCQQYDWSSSKLIKLNKNSNEITNPVSGEQFKNEITKKNNDTIVSEQPSEYYEETSSPNSDAYSLFNGQEYYGTIDSKDVKIKISWNNNKTISAIYYFTDNINKMCSWKGTNYNDGEIKITDFYGDVVNGNGTLTKTLSNNTINWIGEIYKENGGYMNVSIRRAR
jgi:hypothetical protein